LRRLVRIAASAKRHGALSANALLVGAGVVVTPGFSLHSAPERRKPNSTL
jgi:hypothetical protein